MGQLPTRHGQPSIPWVILYRWVPLHFYIVFWYEHQYRKKDIRALENASSIPTESLNQLGPQWPPPSRWYISAVRGRRRPHPKHPRVRSARSCFLVHGGWQNFYRYTGQHSLKDFLSVSTPPYLEDEKFFLKSASMFLIRIKYRIEQRRPIFDSPQNKTKNCPLWIPGQTGRYR